MSVMPRRPNRGFPDEDAAFAAAQYGSGISQRQIAANFGYANSSTISIRICDFVEKYAGVPGWAAWSNNFDRKALLRAAVEAFVKQRNV
jgi:hypothetical protein